MHKRKDRQGHSGLEMDRRGGGNLTRLRVDSLLLRVFLGLVFYCYLCC